MLACFGFIFGGILGSFANALIYRIPLKISFIGTSENGIESSVCPHCQNALKKRDLIPIVSWIFLRGRCRNCSKKIGVRYLLLECCTAIFGAIIAEKTGVSLWSLYFFMMLPFLASFLVIFFRYKDFSMVKYLSLIMIGISFVFLILTLWL